MGGKGIAPLYGSRGNVGGWCTTPLCGRWDNVHGGATGPAWLVTMGGGNWLMIVCMTMLGPLAMSWMTGCDVDMGLGLH